MFTKQCDRCKRPVELKEEPRQPGLICNSCYLLWKDKESEYAGKIGADEMKGKFIDFVNFGANLRNIILK